MNEVNDAEIICTVDTWRGGEHVIGEFIGEPFSLFVIFAVGEGVEGVFDDFCICWRE